jgi:1,4-dihydroxy-2-naphthoate polyprenyltransferase
VSAAPAPVPAGSAPPGAALAWWLAIRPRTLGASLLPVLVGSAVAFDAGQASALVAALCGVAALSLQIATNLANDVFDFLRGIDDATRIGPRRVTQSGWLSPRAVLSATALAIACATAAGIHLVVIGGLPILWIGLASIATAIAYSGGPVPLASHGLGEIAAFIFFGLVAVCGTAYLHLGAVPELAWWAAVPVGALVSCLMLVNNLRDRETDAAAGKRTLAVRIGAPATRALYVMLLALAYAIPPLLTTFPDAGTERLLPWITLPWALRLARALTAARAPEEFHDALARTARIHAAFGLALAAGLAG